MHRGGQRQHARRALGLQLAHRQARIERVAGVDRLEEARGLLDEAEERVLDQEWKLPGAGRGLDQHLVTMRQKIAMPVAAAELAVVVDRMVVAGGRLEGQELRLRHRARRDVEGLADGEVLEVARGAETVAGRIEGLGHGRILAG